MTYVLKIQPTRATFPEDATDEERALIGEHFQYVMAAFEAGQVQYVGRCADATFGLIIFEAESDDAANAFTANDPAIVAGIFFPEVREFMVVFERGMPNERK